SSREEIDDVIEAGADIVMLPFFKTTDEVKTFIYLVGGRATTVLLVETPQAVENIDEILKIPGIDEIHIGLNDLSLGYGKKFMFELLSDGTVDSITEKIKNKGIPFGIGGIAGLEGGALSGKYILGEHYRLGSQMAILSRSFYNTEKMKSLNEAKEQFDSGVKTIRDYETQLCEQNSDFYSENHRIVCEKIKLILNGVKNQ
ncbi:MAG: aldolase/citrate lyase family protein, partial [Oscillospiraceae bacterium]